MPTLQDLANMVVVRNFLTHTVDSLVIKLSNEEVKSIRQRVELLNRRIVDGALKLDLSEKSVREISFKSSIDVSQMTAEDFDKIMTGQKDQDNEKSKSPSKKKPVRPVEETADTSDE